jgi:hypothetical protein
MCVAVPVPVSLCWILILIDYLLIYPCRTHVVPVHQYMYTFPVWCTTDSRFRPKANLPRSGKYRSLCCVMMGPRTTVCYCTPHASHGVEQTPCHALALSSPHHPSLHIQSIHLSASSQPQVVHPRLAQVLTPTHLAAEPIVLPHLPTHVLANATLDFPSSRCQTRVVEDVEMKHFFTVRACGFVGGVVLTRADRLRLLPSKSHRFSSHTQIGVPGVRDMSTRANDRLPR